MPFINSHTLTIHCRINCTVLSPFLVFFWPYNTKFPMMKQKNMMHWRHLVKKKSASSIILIWTEISFRICKITPSPRSESRQEVLWTNCQGSRAILQSNSTFFTVWHVFLKIGGKTVNSVLIVYAFLGRQEKTFTFNYSIRLQQRYW